MLDRISNAIFILIFIIVFIIDGWGLPNGRNISLTILIYTPSIFMLIYTLTKKKIYIPKIAIWFSIFLFFNTLSTFNSTDFQRSRDYLTYYFSLFLIFVYVFNNSEALKNIYVKVLFLICILSLFYGVAFKFFLSSYFTFLVPSHGYQLIHPYAGFLTHHPIGVVGLLLVTMIMVGLFYKVTIFQVLLLIISLTSLAISYMRAGYVSLFGSLLLLLYKYRKIPIKIFTMIVGTLFVVLFAFILVTSPNNNYAPIKDIFKIKTDHVNLYNKTLLNARDKYYLQSLHAIVTRPIFGYGPNNFVTASRKYAQNDAVITETSTNIFLDLIVENGVVAGIAITYFFIAIVINAYRSVSLRDITGMKLFMVYMALLILFQFSYYHGSHTIFLTFIIVGAAIYKENKSEIDTYRLTLTASFLIPLIHIIGRLAF